MTDKKGHKRSKKARHRRGLQGRPLASNGKSHAAERQGDPRGAGVAAASQPAHSPRQENLRAPFVAAGEPPPPLYAALDLGTNNCRLLVAQPTRPGQFRVVDAFSRIVRLGEGLG
ncbi:exopolyphosphatase, partial [Mesorhizobium sp. M1A.F.Ca.IN.020.32.1.1]